MSDHFSSDCAAKLTIAYQFKKDAIEASKILKGYSDMEKSENDMYENAVKFEDEEYFEYETLEDADESSQDSKKGHFEEVHVVGGGGDAVSFLTGILKPNGEEKSKTIEIKKVSPKKQILDTGFDDPTRKHCCNVCNKKFQKRSNLIDHLRLHANVKVFSCDVRNNLTKILSNRLTYVIYSTAKNHSFKLETTKLTSELIPRKNHMHATIVTKLIVSQAL